MSGPRATIGSVFLTARDIERIPAGNIHVPRDQFVALWSAAEWHLEDQARCGVVDWYGAGVVMTCRWLACATVRPSTGAWYIASAPVTESRRLAYEELIEAECLAAEKLDMRRPVPVWVANRPGWLDGVLATLNWAWRRTSGPPLDISASAAG